MSDEGTPTLPPDFAAGGALGGLLNDPSILQLAQELQHDPAFQDMQRVIQQNFAQSMGGVVAENGASGEGATAAPPFSAGDVPPEKAFEAMQKLYTNPQFLHMTERIGQTMLEKNPVMRAMLDPSRREMMQTRFEDLKKDPEVATIMEELEKGDPQAMMQYWNNPAVLKKFSDAVQDVLGEEAAPEEEPAAEGEEEEEEEDLPPSMQLYAGQGDVEGLKKLMDEGVAVDNKDEEGRTGFQFACAYGEMDCITFFLKYGADVNCQDNNKNTAMHYAAGYGQEDVVKLLLDRNCDLSLKNGDGNTAKEVAELNEKTEIVKMLDTAMAEKGMSKLSVK